MAHISVHIQVKEKTKADAFVQVMIEEAVPQTPHGRFELRDVDYAAMKPSLEAIVADALARALSQIDDDQAANRARGDLPGDGHAFTGSDGPVPHPRLSPT